MRLTMAGTGTPHPCLQRAGPGQVVEVAGELLLFDCGEGTLRQLMCAGRVQSQVAQHPAAWRETP